MDYYDDGPDIEHIGTDTSGRYPKGSGDDPYQHSGDFGSRVAKLKAEGMSTKDVAKLFKMNSTELRAQLSLSANARKEDQRATARNWKERGLTNTAIAEKMGFNNESSVRALLNISNKPNVTAEIKGVVDHIRSNIDSKGMILLGAGVERELNISKEKLDKAVLLLVQEGYPVQYRRVPQATNPGKFTTLKLICPNTPEYKTVDGKTPKAIFETDNIHSLKDYVTHDDGLTFDKFVPPKSISSSRVAVRYAEQGGSLKDGLIEIRPGVDDISLGKSHYSQVRIAVDDTHYLKGMAVYNDSLPPGVDIVFNTNKSDTGNKLKAMKEMKVDKEGNIDKDNPFGSLIKAGGQNYYTNEKGEKTLGVINKRADEGDWNDWSDKLPSQFLAKQNKDLIKKQLDLTLADRREELDSILALTNPTVKKVLLKSFADDCDGAAIHLKAKALPGQKYQVIIPSSIKPTDVYAPNFEPGSQVALVRFPHGGIFEIPILTVNNKHAESKKMIGPNPKDAVCINAKTAEQLSGADFDGDTVLVIPINSKIKISSLPVQQELKTFNPKESYGHDKKVIDKDGKPHYYKDGLEFKAMSKSSTQREMGMASNLITDMTLKGASLDKIVRAVKHSMVVIDAEKHGLNYMLSAKENRIDALRSEYQGVTESNGKYHEGASTLISLAKSKAYTRQTKGQPWINKETGAVEWERINPKTGKFESKYVDKSYTDKSGKLHPGLKPSTKMAETKDAHELSSGTIQEELYANYANSVKYMGNVARKEMMATGKIETTPEAKAKYSKEVESLYTKLDVALRNAPKERYAMTIADTSITAKKQQYDDLTKAELKKIKQQEVTKARILVGAKKVNVDITDNEWEAIQSGAVSENKLLQILTNTDVDVIRAKATPRVVDSLSPVKVAKAKAMANIGYSTFDIAKALQVSISTVTSTIGKEETL